ncbi:phage tail assembly protein T [Streptomyces lavendulocolor]
MLAHVSSRELSEWMAYEKIAGPLGGARGDVHAAMIAAAVTNAARAKGRPLPIADFLPRWGRKAEQSPEEMFRAAMAATVAMGGTVISS